MHNGAATALPAGWCVLYWQEQPLSDLVDTHIPTRCSPLVHARASQYVVPEASRLSGFAALAEVEALK